MDDKNTATTTENNTVTRMQAAVDAVSVECSPAHADRLRAAWAETQELLRGWQAIAAGYQEERAAAFVRFAESLAGRWLALPAAATEASS